MVLSFRILHRIFDTPYFRAYEKICIRGHRILKPCVYLLLNHSTDNAAVSFCSLSSEVLQRDKISCSYWGGYSSNHAHPILPCYNSNIDTDVTGKFKKHRGILAKADYANVGSGSAEGKGASEAAAAQAMQSLGQQARSAKGALLKVTGSEENLNMYEISTAEDKLHSYLNGKASIIWGASADNALGDTVKVTVIAATGRAEATS